MLVVSRKPSEAIFIGDEIVVQVVSVRGESVRIGISAPKDMAIVRTELEGETVPRPTEQEDK